MAPTLPVVTSQQQLPVSSSSLAATSSENSAPAGGMAGKTIASVKKQVTEKDHTVNDKWPQDPT